MEEYFKKIDVKHRLRDPVYGFVHLTAAEMRIVDTPLFQRLRRVHQLALTKYVYPSAEHSRFVHSLGVMHCSTLILAGVHDHKQTRLINEPSERLIKTLRFAALLHDIGHLPFSHAVEKQWLSGLKHEALSQYIIEKDPHISSILEGEGVNPREVSSLLAKTPPAKFRLVHEIVSGQLDADRADYLLRDAHLCGAKYGEYDFARFLNIFAATEDGDTGLLTLCVDESDLHVAESLLIARYHYNMQIPFHRTRSGYDIVLGRFMRDFVRYNEPFNVVSGELKEVDLERLALLDDYEITEHIKNAGKGGNPWSPYLLRAKHLVPVIDTSSMSDSGVRLFKLLVRRLESEPSLVKGEDYFVYSREVEILKWGGSLAEKSGPDETGVPPQGMITLLSKEGKGRESEHVDICQRSWIFSHLATDPPSIHRVYVVPEKEQDVRALLDEVNAV
ncbi:HD domain-containing protein [Fundidesulfovibrio putealis]|uniref:HD domain-containing protein n=1 Tax=Fundidesulfovibrio putealis TaxID=270496 RepID=UPI000423A3CE|nr:HD domain-containing protein [Fundidesulfovibrio putealis]